jgi:hypothetical protein
MNSPLQNSFPNQPNSHAAEETLRLLAKLPPPEGLVDRVQSRLRTAPPAAKVLGWPVALRPAGGWMHGDFVRGVAAAAIVCVVAGGAWGIYMHVPPAAAPAAKVIVMPARVGSSGGFSSAGAMRTPDTLKGPVLTHKVKSESQQIEAVQPAPNAAHKAKPGKTKKFPAPAAAIPVR